MGSLGFGSYRVSIKSNEHTEALKQAIQAGIKLIDTSSNYTDGQSELLIGKVLKEMGLSHSPKRPILVTKAGYIQGQNLKVLEDLNAQGLAKIDLLEMTPELKHSIHPEFLENQLNLSLERLGVDCIDTFLLHNPEYFYSLHQDIPEYQRRLNLAFKFLETKVAEGKIKNYGVSSNTLAKNPMGKNPTSLAMLLTAAKSVGEDNHFKVVQFPFNLLEIDALERHQENNLNLIEMCKQHGLTILINRPFNVIKPSGELVRLATYDDLQLKKFDELKARDHFNLCMQIIEAKWNSLRESEDESLYDVEMIVQFKNIYDKLTSTDAVDQVFFGHLFPFLASLWGGQGLNKDEAKPFYELLEYSHLFARKNMSDKAHAFDLEARKLGLLPDENSPLTKRAINAYYSYGVDFVLVGMRKPEYVDQLKDLF